MSSRIFFKIRSRRGWSKMNIAGGWLKNRKVYARRF
jgi:hypothetical protein